MYPYYSALRGMPHAHDVQPSVVHHVPIGLAQA